MNEDRRYRQGVWDGVRETLNFLERERVIGNLGMQFDGKGVNRKWKLDGKVIRFLDKMREE